MKLTLILLSVLSLSFATQTENPVNLLNVQGPLQFNNTTFNLAWSQKVSADYTIQEYLPEGENLGRFNQLLTIHLFQTRISTKEAVEQKIAELILRKQTDAVCNYKMTRSPDGKEYTLDFLLGESVGDLMTIVEFNVYRYKQVKIGKQKAIVVYAYSRRSYGGDIIPFLTSLKEDRSDYLLQMISAEIPDMEL